MQFTFASLIVVLDVNLLLHHCRSKNIYYLCEKQLRLSCGSNYIRTWIIFVWCSKFKFRWGFKFELYRKKYIYLWIWLSIKIIMNNKSMHEKLFKHFFPTLKLGLSFFFFFFSMDITMLLTVCNWAPIGFKHPKNWLEPQNKKGCLHQRAFVVQVACFWSTDG